jgi:hypothetical protein
MAGHPISSHVSMLIYFSDIELTFSVPAAKTGLLACLLLHPFFVEKPLDTSIMLSMVKEAKHLHRIHRQYQFSIGHCHFTDFHFVYPIHNPNRELKPVN